MVFENLGVAKCSSLPLLYDDIVDEFRLAYVFNIYLADFLIDLSVCKLAKFNAFSMYLY